MMDECFKIKEIDDLFETIVSKCPLNELQELQLVSKDWRRRLTSQYFGRLVLGKPALVLVSLRQFWVSHIHSLKTHADDAVYCERSSPQIKFPIRKFMGTRLGLVMLKDNSQDLYLVNPRSMKVALIKNTSKTFNGYALGTLSSEFCVLEVDPQSNKIKTLNLKTNNWTERILCYLDVGWSIDAITQDNGWFVEGKFIWVGRIAREGRVYNALIMYSEHNGIFEFFDFPDKSFEQLPVTMTGLSEHLLGIWSGDHLKSFWVFKVKEEKYEQIYFSGYSSMAGLEPLYFLDEQHLVVRGKRSLNLYNVKHHIIENVFTLTVDCHHGPGLKAMWFKDTYDWPSEDQDK